MAITLDGTTGITTPAIPSGGPIAGTTGTFSGAVSGTTGTFSGAVQANGVATNLYPLVSGTEQASTSGTSIDFTGIPSWAKRVTVMLKGVSTSGTSSLLIQIGSTTFTTSGYVGTSGVITTGAAVVAMSTGFLINCGGNDIAANNRNGIVAIGNISGNDWCAVATVTTSGTGASVSNGSGAVSLSGVLDRVRITTTGADTFDAGTINIMWE